MNEKAHLYYPVFRARAEGSTKRAKALLDSAKIAHNSALGHSKVLWVTVGNARSTTNATLGPIFDQGP